MKIKIEIDENIVEEEIILHCRELNDKTIAIQKQISEAVNTGLKLTVGRGDMEYFLDLKEILFFETAGSTVAVHAANQIYETHLRLYELEELLPGNFLRVSKSTILNSGKIRSVRKNIAGASEVEFEGTAKKAFGSVSKYVNSDCFQKAKISNSFGECNVFFNNAILAGSSASIKVENSFGSTNVYLPSTWRIVTRQAGP